MVKEFLKKYLPTVIILVVAILLIAIGVSQKQYAEVFTKAVNICLECIGIG